MFIEAVHAKEANTTSDMHRHSITYNTYSFTYLKTYSFYKAEEMELIGDGRIGDSLYIRGQVPTL